MPLIFYLMSICLPATYMMDIACGIIRRGAVLSELRLNLLVLLAMGALVLFMAAENFRKVIA